MRRHCADGAGRRGGLVALRGGWAGGAGRVVVLCGTGNNGGDGYVLARLALQAALPRDGPAGGRRPSRAAGDALTARDAYLAAGAGSDAGASLRALPDAEVMVDALLGTGLERAPRRGRMAGHGRGGQPGGRIPVLAIDLPSGLHADTGGCLGAAVRAEAGRSPSSAASRACTPVPAAELTGRSRFRRPRRAGEHLRPADAPACLLDWPRRGGAGRAAAAPPRRAQGRLRPRARGRRRSRARRRGAPGRRGGPARRCRAGQPGDPPDARAGGDRRLARN